MNKLVYSYTLIYDASLLFILEGGNAPIPWIALWGTFRGGKESRTNDVRERDWVRSGLVFLSLGRRVEVSDEYR